MQPPPGREFYVPPPDWDAEHREFEARERVARIAEATALLEEAAPPARPDPPAKKRRWRKGAE